jgi:hypothetical protein
LAQSKIAVRHIIELCDQGASNREIAAALYAEGLPPGSGIALVIFVRQQRR